MPLMVVKSLFHGAFLVASRRHAGSSFRTSAIVSRAKSGSCSASAGFGTGAAGTDFSRSRLRLMKLSYQRGKPRRALLQKRGEAFLRLASGEEESEGRALELVAAAAREELRGDVERELAAGAELENAVGNRARVELAEK